MNERITHTVLVCHSNRNLVRLAEVQASRHGIKVIVARDGADVVAKAAGQVRPDAIVLSNDLKNPTTDEIVQSLNRDPRLAGIRVIVLKGGLNLFREVIGGFRLPPMGMK